MISEREMMHGQDYNREDVSGWLMSEKLNGCRAYWDGSQMWSRGGNVIAIPERWRADLPAYALDGEIYAGTGNFEVARQAVQYGRWTPECRFHVFDVPDFPGTYAERYRHLRSLFRVLTSPVCLISHVPIKNISEAVLYMHLVQKHGGEGVVLRDPANLYRPGRSAEILKLKQWVTV